MRKADVSISYHNGTRGDPMVNVKVYAYPFPTRELAEKVGREFFDAEELAEFVEWVLALDEETVQSAWDVACESGWECLQSDAEELFGPGVKVYSAGRSGGWAVVHGLDDVESWDAIALGRWAKWARWARATADAVPEVTLELLAINAWEWEREERAAAREDLTYGVPMWVGPAPYAA